MGTIYGSMNPLEKTHTTVIDTQKNKSKSFSAASLFASCNYKSAQVGGHAPHAVPSIHQSGNLLAIIEGHPNWVDSKLAAMAESHCAANVLLEGFALYGRMVLEKIRGPFSFCILDPEQQYALLAVDRIGIRPLSIYFQNYLLVFGSELDQVLAHPGVTNAIDSQAIFNYLYFHMIPSPGTVYSGVTKLQPGEFFEISRGQANRNFYWHLPNTESTYSKNELFEQLHCLLEKSTLDCSPNVTTGTFLSGGLDSSTVTGMLQKISTGPIDAFTMGFHAEGYDEMEYARASARHFNVNLHEYYVTPADVLKAIPLIAQTYDEPFGNASAIPTFYCAKLAREHGMTHLLAGDGGDEIFAGNSRYAKQKVFELYRYCPKSVRSLLEPFAAINLPLLTKIKSYIEQAKTPMPERMETYNFLNRTALTDIFEQDFLNQIDPSLPLSNLRQTYERSTSNDLVKKMLFLDGKFTLADNDLRKVNRMCDLAGISVNYPMLNENLVEFAATIPSKWLMRGFELRSFYREAMKSFLPPETLKKDKQGFGLPFGVWMSNDAALKNFAEDNLNGIAKRDFLNPSYIKNLIKLHRQGHASYYGVMIWILVMLEQWLVSHDH